MESSSGLIHRLFVFVKDVIDFKDDDERKEKKLKWEKGVISTFFSVFGWHS